MTPASAAKATAASVIMLPICSSDRSARAGGGGAVGVSLTAIVSPR
jgi:hypothetical protein